MKVYNLATGDYAEYSDANAESRLITHYLLETSRASCIHNERIRQEAKAKIERCGKDGRTLVIGDFGTIDNNRNVKVVGKGKLI